MKEEDTILKKVGTGNKFQVPEGYFENLTSSIMDKISAKEDVDQPKPIETTLWTKVKPLVYMAAMFVGAALIIRVMLVNTTPQDQSIAYEHAVSVPNFDEIEDNYIGVIQDEYQLDNYSMYMYLTNNELEY